MGQVFGKLWKTNNRDLICFARICSIVLKHHSRTDDDLLNIADVCDRLNARKDITMEQHSRVILRHKDITGKPFQDSGWTGFDDPSSRFTDKSEVFQKALASHGIDMENFDPFQKWELEPGIEQSKVEKFDYSKIRLKRGPQKGGEGIDPCLPKYRPGRIAALYRSFGKEKVSAPSPSSELANESVKKMLAGIRERRASGSHGI
jgi:hypothetical protein